MVVEHRLQGIGRKAEVSLFKSFNYIQMAYDTVDRTFLWQVLTYTRVQPQMIAVIRQIHDGVITYVRFDDGILPDLFEKGQGLRRGRVISPPLLHRVRSRADRRSPTFRVRIR